VPAGQHKRLECKVCKLNPQVVATVDTMMASGDDFADIYRWFREQGDRPPTRLMMNRHFAGAHYMGQAINNGDSQVVRGNGNGNGQAHNNGMSLIQSVTMNIAHTIIPRLANIPDQINIVEELQELYVFTKNQLATEFEISQNTPEEYIHPITGESQLFTPTSPAMMKLIKLLQEQLKGLDEATKNIKTKDDLGPDISIALMAITKGDTNVLALIQSHLQGAADLVNAEVIEEVEVVDEEGDHAEASK